MRNLLFFLLIFIFNTKNFAQCDTSQVKITVFVKTDIFPKETGWMLSTADLSQMYHFSPAGTYTDSLTIYKKEVCVPKNKCIRFWLTDQNGKGFNEGGFPGYCVVKMGNDTVAKILYYEFSHFEYFNCAPGLTCSNPKPVAEGNHIAPNPNFFYEFQPKKNGNYRISTCDPANKCDTKIYVYEACKTFNALLSETGYLKVADNSATCDTLAVIDQIVLNKKTPYVIRIGGKGCENKQIKWKIESLGVIKGCRDSTACNFNFLAEEDGEACYPQNTPQCKGPDLVIRGDSIARTMYLAEENADLNPCLINEGCLAGTGKRKVLRFSSWIENVGDQDYYIGRKNSNPFQFVFDACHQHFHYNGYAEYLLFDSKGNKVPVGFKAGFCVTDLQCTDATNMKFACEDMGISKTCSDVYDKTLDCQWIDVTDVPDGKYTFVARVNWDNSPDKLGRMESRIDNNWAQVCLEINRDANGKISFKVDSSKITCPPFKDCKGVAYGNSVPDCDNTCGGKSVHGDWNKDQKQDLADIQQYLQETLNNATASKCADLNDDGKINVADASLLTSCISIGKKHLHVGSSAGAHDHCRFPAKVFKQTDTVFFKIQNYNPTAKYFDIAMRSPYSDVNAYQLSLSNVQISKVQSLVDSTKYPSLMRASLNKGSVLSISPQDSVIKRSPFEKPLCRIYFSNIATTKVTLEKIVAVTNKDGYSLFGKIDGTALTISSDKEPILMNLNPIVYPNPIRDEAILEFYNPENESFSLEIYDLNGRQVQNIKNITESQVTIQRNNLSKGFYLYKLKGEKGFASGKLVFE